MADYLKPVREAINDVCIARMISSGQAGNASMRAARLISNRRRRACRVGCRFRKRIAVLPVATMPNYRGCVGM